MREKIRHVCDLILGLLILITTILGYYKDISYMSEYCFVSGIIIGIIFVISFINYIKNKKYFPEWVYSNCMITTLIIFIATLAIKLNLEGAFWFIHIINPLLLFIYWCIFCNHNKITNQLLVGTNIVFPICYMFFAQIIFLVTDKCPFPAKLILVGNPWYVIIGYIVLLCIIFLALGYALHFLNKYIYRKVNKEEN